MNNMNKGIISKLEVKFFNLLGNISVKVADGSTRACVSYFVYEPEFPKELLENVKQED